jgi:oxygen-independent coproporphyrinogen III oxidase
MICSKGSIGKLLMPPFRHLYVHIPFCPKVCPYCSFYKEASDRSKTQRFLDSVLAELDMLQRERPVAPETIFFGGGTPSALSTPQLEYLLGGLRERLDLSALQEWTLEMNPATVSLEKARALRALGVNRISMGVQSWDPQLLNVLGRVHSAEQAERSYTILREAGFNNVNLDLIFAVPTQSRAQWVASLEKTIALGPEHISAYCLTYEEDTAFFARFRKGELTQDSEWDADLFEMTMDTLGAAGFEQYEISNYARPGRECRHNLAYWLGADYLGLGPSAFSTAGARRWQNAPDTAAYCDRILGGSHAETFSETLDDATRRAERIAFSLRTNRGVTRDLIGPWREEVAQFETDGFLRADGDCVLLTRRGKLVADAVAETFV